MFVGGRRQEGTIARFRKATRHDAPVALNCERWHRCSREERRIHRLQFASDPRRRIVHLLEHIPADVYTRSDFRQHHAVRSDLKYRPFRDDRCGLTARHALRDFVCDVVGLPYKPLFGPSGVLGPDPLPET